MGKAHLPRHLQLAVTCTTVLAIVALATTSVMHGVFSERQFDFRDLTHIVWVEFGLVAITWALMWSWGSIAKHLRDVIRNEPWPNEWLEIALMKAYNCQYRAREMFVGTCIATLTDMVGLRLWVVARAVDAMNHAPTPAAFPSHMPLLGFFVLIGTMVFVGARWCWESHKLSRLQNRYLESWADAGNIP